MVTINYDVVSHDRGGGNAIKDAGDHLDKTGDKAERFKKRAQVAFAASTAAIVAFGASSVGAAVEAETAQAKLNDAFERFPKLADVNIEAMRDLNTEMGKKTKFDDDSLASGQSVLAQFDLTGKQIMAITPLLADYAAKTGMEVPDAAEKLGKAFMGQTKSLKALGINYKSTGNKAKDVANITALLREKVGGFAEKEGKTAAGQAAILKNQFGELQEAIGAKLIPILMKVAEFGLKALKWIEENKQASIIIVSIVGALWLLNAALAANPVVLIAAGIALLIAGLVLLWTKSAGFRDFMIGAWEVLKAAVMLYASVYIETFNIIKAATEKVIDFFIAGWQLGERVFHKVIGAIVGAFTGSIQWIVDRWNDFIGFFNNIPYRIGQALAGLGRVISDAFKFAFNMGINAINYFIDRANDAIYGINVINPFSDIPYLPHIARLHGGGIVPGARGTERLSILEAGETVLPAGKSPVPGAVQVTFAGDTSSAFATAFMKLVRDGTIQLGAA